MAACEGVKLQFLLTTAIVVFGSMILTVGITTSEWTVYNGTIIYGLWRFCNDDFDCVPIPDQFVGPGYIACRVFMSLAIACCILSIVLTCVYLCVPKIHHRRNEFLPILSSSLGIFAAVCILIATIVWGTLIDFVIIDPNHSSQLGSSFYLSVVSAGFVLVGGVAGLCSMLFRRCWYRGSYQLIPD
ncbi:uncharacterized protein LOC131930977 [Physella acuta]|uniref:uncharacterized protein LOC131930977 n=1 Tax=Physella acuta TaxID=109671 RepID=UPI0027DDECD1|nr:uncharacterized protein LOC131930977 [Physella acuta]XP_059143628.1 uncharacterized protein LOC131930977 [Physella acuta]XP_059143629.1 uncharacterized protein LOC131930977 [Physella acuta]